MPRCVYRAYDVHCGHILMSVFRMRRASGRYMTAVCPLSSHHRRLVGGGCCVAESMRVMDSHSLTFMG